MPKNQIDIDIACKSGLISANGSNSVVIQVENADYGEILDSIGMDTAIEHFGNISLLDAIGRDAVLSHFGIDD